MTERIKLPGDRGGTSGPQKIKVYAAVAHNGEDAIILNWKEKEPLFGSYVDYIMSSAVCDYGLDEPPYSGVWVFEGTLKISSHKGGDPMEPQDWETTEHWEGEWRTPKKKELKQWAKFKPKLVGKIGPEPIQVAKPDGTPGPMRIWLSDKARTVLERDTGFCGCGKHVSECCCGESHGSNHHPSGRSYDEEDYEQFYK